MRIPQKTILFVIVFLAMKPLLVQSQNTREILKTKIGSVSFDRAITGFHFTMIMKERYVYSLNGKKDINNPNLTTGFLFEARENMDYESAVSYVMQLSQHFGESNLDKMLATMKDTILNIQGHKSFCSSFSVFDKDSKKVCNMLIGAVPNNNKTILFLSNDYSNNLYGKKFFMTFQSIRF